MVRRGGWSCRLVPNPNTILTCELTPSAAEREWEDANAKCIFYLSLIRIPHPQWGKVMGDDGMADNLELDQLIKSNFKKY
jgi:hypothetical protein